MQGWHEGFVEHGGVSLRYLRAGAGPPLLLAHGMTDSAECWGPVAEELARDHTVVAYDARAHGRSAAPEAGYSGADLADDLAGIVRALGLERPALIGHSMGAETCALAAATYPDLARAVVLEDPPWRLEPPPQAVREEVAAWIEGLHRQERAALIEAARAEGRVWGDEEFAPWAEAKHRVSPRILQWFWSVRPDWRDLASRLSCPALVLGGEKELGAIVAEETAAELRGLLPDGRVELIAGAGHSVRRDRRAPFVALVRAFLAERGA